MCFYCQFLSVIMYDTIQIFCKDMVCSPEYLTNYKETADPETGELNFTGNLNNLYVKKGKKGTSISNSLSKFYFNDNLEKLTRQDVKFALEKISDLLKMQVENGIISRLDFGSNFILKEPVYNYYSCLGNLARFKKFQYENEALLYKTSSKSIEFYDKTTEIVTKKGIIPEQYIGKNILRIESHLTNRINKMLNVKELKAEDIYKAGIYKKCAKIWNDMYFKIQRINSIKFNAGKIKMINPSTLKNQMALITLKAVGEAEFISMIEANKNSIDERNFYRLKKFIKELSNEPNFTEPNECIKELDKLVSMEYEYNISN